MKPLYWFSAGVITATLVLRIAYGYTPVSISVLGLNFSNWQGSPETLKAIIAFAWAANALFVIGIFAIVVLLVGRKT